MSAGCVLSSTDFAGSTNRPGTAEPYQWLYPNPDTTDEENTESTTDEPEEETDPNMERIVDFQNLQQINPEILAWITVPGTPIDYPVALGEDNSYYLNHTVTGESNILGSILQLPEQISKKATLFYMGITWHPGKCLEA